MKIQRISEYQYELEFESRQEQLAKYKSSFLSSELGKIYQSIPWEKLVESFGIKDKKKGPQSIFSPRGKLGLMFLKHYASCSDYKLIEQLNGNLDYQYFCDILLPLGHRIKNYKIVSSIRCELACKLDISQAQKELIEHWLPHLNNLDSISCDATCYESAIRYPTDIKLLWEAVSWSYEQMKTLSRHLKIKRLRTKYKKWLRRYVSYSKMRQKRRKKRKALKRGLLHLLNKLNRQLDYLESQIEGSYFTNRYHRRRSAIQLLYEQQQQMFVTGEKKVKDRIVSIDKPYIRPIVRGKENKPVEFGAKVNKLQIDGISFIEHLSFDAFNEGTRLIETIFLAQKLTKKRVKVLGADAIYANNKNRRFVTKYGIKTDFKPKGRPSKHRKHQDQLAQMITKERVSRLEGSFGTDKEHFLLKKNLARTKATETLMIFFGIHTSNALLIGRRMEQKAVLAA
jgi:hypothetical protein